MQEGTLRGLHLHRQPQSPELLHQHIKGLRSPRLQGVFPLHNGLVYASAPFHIITLYRQKLLQGIGGPVSFQGPHLHLPKALAAELSFAPQRLLGDKGIGPDGAGMHFVINKVGKLHHVNVANCRFLVEFLPRVTIPQFRGTRGGKPCFP